MVYNDVMGELVAAYFTEYSIFYLTNAFDKVMTDLRKNNLLSQSDHKNHLGELTRIVLALLLTVLLEHGQVVNHHRYAAEGSTLCNISNFPQYCLKLGIANDYAKWTHLILYLISILRTHQMFDFYTNDTTTIYQ